MAKSHFCLRSDTYKSRVFEGFSELQQSDEFVDMTLAAGDQFVKVHKTLIVLASPYLKALLQAIPCQHPVLFLTNVKPEELNFILEYIYTGEVNIPPEKLESFLIAAQAMHIRGLENIVFPGGNNTNDEAREEKQESQAQSAPAQVFRTTKIFPVVKANITINQNDFSLQVEPNTQIPINNTSELTYPLLELNNGNGLEEFVGDVEAGIGTNNISANLGNNDVNGNNDIVNNMEITYNPITSDEINHIPIVTDEIPQNIQRPFLNIGKAAFTIENNFITNGKSDVTVDSSNQNNPTSFSNFFNIASQSSIVENDAAGNDLNDLDCGDNINLRTSESIDVHQKPENEADGVKDKDSILYTISSRGSLQLIMNRFMYYSHYTRDGGRKRRWRCIEYRDRHCPAAIDTDGETIIARKQKHSHANHDKKIWNKVVKSRVFSSLSMAQDTIKEKQSLPNPVIEEVILSE